MIHAKHSESFLCANFGMLQFLIIRVRILSVIIIYKTNASHVQASWACQDEAAQKYAIITAYWQILHLNK